MHKSFNYWAEIGEVKACTVFLVPAKSTRDLLVQSIRISAVRKKLFHFCTEKKLFHFCIYAITSFYFQKRSQMRAETLFSWNLGNEGTLVRLNITIETSGSYKMQLAPAI